MAKNPTPLEWTSRVSKATSVSELDDLYLEAVRGGFYDRAKYVLIRQNQATIGAVNNALSEAAQKALAPLDRLTQQGAGLLLRETVPGLVDEFGNLNAVLAKEYYDKQSLLNNTVLRGQYTRKGLNKAARARATKQLAGQIYKAGLPAFDIAEKTESIIGYGMKSFMEYGGVQAASNVENAMTRAVASYNRDTMLYNSALDPDVIGVQRVAEPDACSFCQMVAFDQYGGERVSGYAADYHNHCRCSIETIYRNTAPVRPDYYDDFEYSGVYTDSEVDALLAAE